MHIKGLALVWQAPSPFSTLLNRSSNIHAVRHYIQDAPRKVLKSAGSRRVFRVLFIESLAFRERPLMVLDVLKYLLAFNSIIQFLV